MIKILWPDGPRMVTEDWVLSLARDSWCNNAPAQRCLDCGQNSLVENGCPHNHTEPVYPEGSDPCPETLDDAMNWLMDMGEVTFASSDGGYAQEDPGDGGNYECDYPDDGDSYDDQMDGDHQSALASAGMGTDEDYGDFGGGENDD